MKRLLFMIFLVLFTMALCIVEIKTEFRDEMEPKVNQTDDYSGVFVMTDIPATCSNYMRCEDFVTIELSTEYDKDIQLFEYYDMTEEF